MVLHMNWDYTSGKKTERKIKTKTNKQKEEKIPDFVYDSWLCIQ
jgi:hypothetical protein